MPSGQIIGGETGLTMEKGDHRQAFSVHPSFRRTWTGYFGHQIPRWGGRASLDPTMAKTRRNRTTIRALARIFSRVRAARTWLEPGSNSQGRFHGGETACVFFLGAIKRVCVFSLAFQPPEQGEFSHTPTHSRTHSHTHSLAHLRAHR